MTLIRERQHVALAVPFASHAPFLLDGHNSLQTIADAEYEAEIRMHRIEQERMIKTEIVRALLLARNPAVPLEQPEIEEILRQARAEPDLFDVPTYREDLTEEVNALIEQHRRPEADMGEHRPTTETPAVDTERFYALPEGKKPTGPPRTSEPVTETLSPNRGLFGGASAGPDRA